MKKIISIILIAVLLSGALSSCGKKKSSDTVLKIGTSDITGNFNPFYCESEGDKKVSGQIYMPVQYVDSSNSLVNRAGGISYEYVGSKQVKYIVTIRNDLFFPDGTNVTIDDVIYWYYVLADATYDGPFKNFFQNDIVGLKEYYYDDKNYAGALALLPTKSDVKKYIARNYANGIDVKEISGIKRIDDYACSILFNSRNINAVSQINPFIVSKAFLSKDYVKGSAEKIKNYKTEIPGCGAYTYSESEKNKVKLIANPYYESSENSFKELQFVDLSVKKQNPFNAIKSGSVDIITAELSEDGMSKISDERFKYFITNKPAYSSLCFNTERVPNDKLRKAIMGAANVSDIISSSYNTYFTKPYSPLSVRFKEYPSDIKADYYDSSALTSYKIIYREMADLKAYCTGDENGVDYLILDGIKKALEGSTISLNIICCTESELKKLVSEGKADLWIESFEDGATCDKYDYYNSNGSKNYFRLSAPEIDSFTERIRKSTGFDDKSGLTASLMKLVMEQAVEFPLYQLQNITVYNTETVNPESLENLSGFDDYTYVIPNLYA